MSYSDRVEAAFTMIGAAVRAIDGIDPTLIESDEENARWVMALDGLKRRAGDHEKQARYVLAARLPYGTPTVLAGHVWEAHRTSSRTGWDNDAVRRLVMKTARFDPETGEARTADDALGVIAKLYPLGGSGLRTKAARELIPDFDADEYAHVEKRLTVRNTESNPTEEV